MTGGRIKVGKRENTVNLLPPGRDWRGFSLKTIAGTVNQPDGATSAPAAG